MRRFVVLAILSLMLSPLALAQNTTSESIRKQVTTLVKSYEGEKGVMAVASEDGFMLQTIKMMLRKQFGKEFAEAIKAFAIISYEKASAEVANKIVAEIGQIVAPLKKIDVSDKMTKGETAEGYVLLSEGGKEVNDLLIVISAPTPSMIYIGGEFNADTARMGQ